MAETSRGGFWQRLWAAARAMENQRDENLDYRLSAIEHEIAALKLGGNGSSASVTQPTLAASASDKA